FDVDIPGGAVLRESDSTAPGEEAIAIEIAGAPVGVTICYDVRFPELYRSLVKDPGAEILLVPAAFTPPPSRAPRRLLPPPRRPPPPAAPRALHRGSGLGARRGPVESPQRQARELRPQRDRRSVGDGGRRARRGRWRRGRDAGRRGRGPLPRADAVLAARGAV